MRDKRVFQGLIGALAALGTTKTEILQVRLGVRQPAQSDKRRR
jgi:hypothetical protein